jgi:osmoprotectant transport system substrate-binding protein
LIRSPATDIRAIPRRTLCLALAAQFLVSLTGCISVGAGGAQGPRRTALATGDDAITIASFDFPESRLLSEIYAQALESKGFRVERAFGLGPRELVQPALEKGLVEFVPEYLGTALQFVTREAGQASSFTDAEHRRLTDALRGRGITVLEPAPAQDANAVAVSAATAAKFGLKTISDLAPVAGQLVLGGPPECPSRPLCLPGLEKTYGLKFLKFVGLDAGGPYTVAELSAGLIGAAVLFTTDWQISARGFVVLDDDRSLQPAENVTPVVRSDIVATYGDRFVYTVNAVSASLTTVGLRELNSLVGTRSGTVARVATVWLRSKGLIPD